MNRSFVRSLLVVACIATVTPAQEKVANTAVDDRLFAVAASDSGMAEISISGLGLQRASHADLKKFSEQMIEDHNRLNQELTRLAAQKGFALSRAVDARAQFCSQSLAGLSGERSDRCYAKAQLAAHMEAVGAFEAEAERGQDAEMRALAAKALPQLKEHLTSIKTIVTRLEAATASAGGE